jgi:hypothetical protein
VLTLDGSSGFSSLAPPIAGTGRKSRADTADGPRSAVDARPSDAVNLAVLSGAPIWVDAAILDDPVVDSHPE